MLPGGGTYDVGGGTWSSLTVTLTLGTFPLILVTVDGIEDFGWSFIKYVNKKNTIKCNFKYQNNIDYNYITNCSEHKKGKFID